MNDHKNQHHLNQIQILVEDLNRMCIKCQKLCQDLNHKFQMPNLMYYQSLIKNIKQRLSSIKSNKISLIKNQLIKAINELLDLQQKIINQKAKQQALKKINNSVKLSNEEQNQNNNNSSYTTKPESKRIMEVPIFQTKDSSIENKIDFMSKYISCVKKNIKRNSDTDEYNPHLMHYLLNQPSFTQMKQQLEKYQMQNQQIEYYIENKIKNNLKLWIKQHTYSNNEEKTVLRIKKSNIPEIYQIIEQINSQQIKQQNKSKNNNVQKKVDQSLKSIKILTQEQILQFSTTLNNMNKQLDASFHQLLKLRERRRRQLSDSSPIWNQFKQI